MKLFDMIKNFRNDEDGAVTVDWVVLTAAVVGLGFLVFQAVAPGLTALGAKISSTVSAVGVETEPTLD